ncbi:MAG: hypothetical protein KBS81_08035, partial [Spirochaetales bacterium]|nr:hypothetical protein [Candidatus Physcosoma equi]
EIAERKGALHFLDAGGKYLKGAFPSSAFFLKPNKEEILGLYSEEDTGKEEQFLTLSRRLQKETGGNLLVTLGGDGALFLNDRTALQCKVPQVEVVSTIGSGDSTVAGFVHGCQKGFPLEDSIRFALASGTVNAMHREVGAVTKEEVEKLLPLILLSSL